MAENFDTMNQAEPSSDKETYDVDQAQDIENDSIERTSDKNPYAVDEAQDNNNESIERTAPARFRRNVGSFFQRLFNL